MKVFDTELRRNSAGRTLLARVYQPEGAGPFPVLLDLHGGAWTRKDRLANEPMDKALAASGVLVVAVDLTLSGEAPYPAAVQDASYAVRWLKWKAEGWSGDPATLGILGNSSGGHLALLLALRPDDARYNAIALPEAPTLDTRVRYLALRAPVSDPLARFGIAEKLRKEELVKASQAFFRPWEAIHDGNPQEILQRREHGALPPILIMHGGADDHVLPENQRKFADAWRAAGGECRLEIFDGAEHEWTAKPGPLAERAHEMVQAFVARQAKAMRETAA